MAAASIVERAAQHARLAGGDGLLGGARQRHRRRHRLQAPAPAAAARRAVGDDRAVTDLARQPALPEEEPPVGDDARADPHVDVDADVGPHAARGAHASLGDRDARE